MAAEDQVRQRILDVFRAFNIGAGEVLPEQSLEMRLVHFPPPERRLVDQVLDQMISDGLVEELQSPPGLVLTEKGEALVYETTRSMAVEDRVRQRILDVFRAFNIGAGGVLPEQSLEGNILDFPPPERRLVDQVLDRMISDGWVEELESPPGGLVLTEKGETQVYRTV
jgi:ribosomal protein S19E (S16A)